MNHWQHEFLAEYHHQRIQEELKQIRLERTVTASSRVYRPRLFERTMFKFANWMISTGKHLRKRYEVPAVNCDHPSTGSLAMQ